MANHNASVKPHTSNRKSTIDPSLLQSLKWRCIGPYRGGRVVAVAGNPAHTQVFYFDEAGIHRASVHSLRHTFGTHMVKKGTNFRVVRETIGHKDFKPPPCMLAWRGSR